MGTVDGDYEIFTITHVVFLVLFFCVGLVIQMQIISVSYKDKDTAWTITITHSIVTTINFAFNISFDAVTHFIPYLSQYTGNWICYVASFVTTYCYYGIVAYSFLISILKYIFIIHHVKIREWGKEKIKKWFFVANLLHPCFLAIVHVVILYTSRNPRNSSIISCFGLTEAMLREYNTSSSSITKFLICPLKKSTEDANWNVYYVTEQCVCLMITMFNIIVTSNLLEGFIYYKIFKKMRR